MNRDNTCDISDLLSLFEDTLLPEDVLASRLMAQVSGAIVKERINRNMSQTEFAEYIGVTQSQVSKWEQGGNNFTLQMIAEVATRLNMTVNIQISNNNPIKSKGWRTVHDQMRQSYNIQKIKATTSTIELQKGGDGLAQLC